MCIAQTQRCLCALFQIFGLYFGQLKNHSLSTLIGECGEGKKHKFQSWKTIRFANLTQRMVWVPNYSDTPTVILAIFNVAFSINWQKYIHLWYNTLFVSLQKKNNTYFCFNKLTKKKCHLQHLFQPLFHLVSRNHVAVASLTRCLVAEFVGNRKVMSLKMVNGFQTSNWMKFSWDTFVVDLAPENQPPNPGFTNI